MLWKTFFVRTEKEKNQNAFYELKNKKFQHGQKAFNSAEEIMKCSEINKVYVKLSNCKNFLQMINGKKLFWLSFTIFINFFSFYFDYIYHFHFCYTKPYVSKLRQQLQIIILLKVKSYPWSYLHKMELSP